MASFLNRALESIKRGWYVLPLTPGAKNPLGRLVRHGFLDASNDEAVIRRWWKDAPDANVGIACGKSELTVLDIDEGFQTADDARAWMERNGLPSTYAVHTGRRFSKKDGTTPEYGLQLYYVGSMPDIGLFVLDGCSGQVKSLGGLVMAEGNIHPGTGLAYEAAWEWTGPLTPLPENIRALKSETKQGLSEPGKKIPEGAGRHDALMRVACGLRNRGLDGDAIYAAMQPVNEAMCEVPISDGELEAMCYGIERRYPIGAPEPTVTLGPGRAAEPEVPADPWEKYHTLDELLNVPEGKFIVDGILYENSITALAGYAGDRKSIISLNLAAACVTGQPFMGRFAVVNPPKRVLYLCPEMGLRELAKLASSLGMMEHVGMSLFFRSLDKGGKIKLSDLTAEELRGALVILDTAIRFVDGSENDPQDMARFSDELFRLRNLGATVWVLFHSSKASVGQELSLQNAVRGSSEIAAMLSMCWATRLNEPEKRFDSTSRMYPLKVREFEALPFDFGCDRATAACSIIGEPAPVAVLKNRKADERRLIIRELVQHDPEIGVNRIQAILRERTGSGGNAKWVSNEKKLILRGGGSVLTED